MGCGFSNKRKAIYQSTLDIFFIEKVTCGFDPLQDLKSRQSLRRKVLEIILSLKGVYF